MRGQHASTPKKERRVKRRKGIEAQRVKPSTPSQSIDALIGDEEQNGKQKKKKKKETERVPNPATPDPLVASTHTHTDTHTHTNTHTHTHKHTRIYIFFLLRFSLHFRPDG